MTKPKIVIDAWAKLQHFKDRDPIWVKLYRDLRHDRRWRQLSGDGCKLYIDLTLLAATDEPFGSIMLLPEDLAWEVRLDVPALLHLLAEVDASGLIHASGYHADIKMITSGDQDDDRPLALTRGREAEVEEEVERETTNDQPKKNGRVHDDRNVYVDVEEFVLFGKEFGVSPAKIEAILEQ